MTGIEANLYSAYIYEYTHGISLWKLSEPQGGENKGSNEKQMQN